MANYKKKPKRTDPSYSRVKKKPKTGTPAERFLRFQITTSASADTETSHYLDIAKALSEINRRHYRQGRTYSVRSVSVTSRNSSGALVSLGTVGNTWVARGAWNRGFQMWNKMNDLVLANQPTRKSKYHDFKVYLTDDHRTSSNKLRPLDNGNNQAGEGEWVYSEMVSPDGTTSADAFKMHMLGDHNGSPGNWTSVSLIRSYGEARATVPNTSVPAIDGGGDDDPILNLFDDGTQVDEIAQNLDSYGDLTPYANDSTLIGENYPGSSGNLPKPMVQRLGSLSNTSNGMLRLGGFDAICGLVEIEVASQQPNDTLDIIVEIAQGDYKGVKADVI
jgi:hypothetical protein